MWFAKENTLKWAISITWGSSTVKDKKLLFQRQKASLFLKIYCTSDLKCILLFISEQW